MLCGGCWSDHRGGRFLFDSDRDSQTLGVSGLKIRVVSTACNMLGGCYHGSFVGNLTVCVSGLLFLCEKFKNKIQNSPDCNCNAMHWSPQKLNVAEVSSVFCCWFLLFIIIIAQVILHCGHRTFAWSFVCVLRVSKRSQVKIQVGPALSEFPKPFGNHTRIFHALISLLNSKISWKNFTGY